MNGSTEQSPGSDLASRGFCLGNDGSVSDQCSDGAGLQHRSDDSKRRDSAYHH